MRHHLQQQQQQIGMPPTLSPLMQPGGPRATSPLMFGQQPPPHAIASPAPLHPAGASSSSSQPAGSTSNLQVSPGGNTARVPSPQELVAHTQAIMQKAIAGASDNLALIKR